MWTTLTQILNAWKPILADERLRLGLVAGILFPGLLYGLWFLVDVFGFGGWFMGLPLAAVLLCAAAGARSAVGTVLKISGIVYYLVFVVFWSVVRFPGEQMDVWLEQTTVWLEAKKGQLEDGLDE